MKTLLCFGASNSSTSINVQLARFATTYFSEYEINFIDLNDYEMPIFSIDREKQSGVPELAHRFKDHIRQADGILISFAEHNGSYSVAFKNVMDWASRIEQGLWDDKPMCLLASSPGGRGGQSVLQAAINRFQYMNGTVISHFSLPFFNDNFDSEQGVLKPDLARHLKGALQAFKSHLEQS